MARKFDREFKLEAIRMASEEGITAREVEQRLGLSVGIISRWKKQLKDNGDEAFPGTGHLRQLGGIHLTGLRDVLSLALGRPPRPVCSRAL